MINISNFTNWYIDGYAPKEETLEACISGLGSAGVIIIIFNIIIFLALYLYITKLYIEDQTRTLILAKTIAFAFTLLNGVLLYYMILL